MSTVKHAAESAENSSIGRITPLNMSTETNGLNYDSLIRDMTAANDYDGDNDCSSHKSWA